MDKIRRKYLPEDEFFCLGNSVRENKWRCLDIDEDQEMPDWISCNVGGCRKEFSSRLDFEYHYQMVHRNACRNCRSTFPNFHLLDLHVSERHDSFFQAMASRQPMYKCLEATCSSVFSTDKERSKHLQQTHCYSKEFRFHKGKRRKENLSRAMKNLKISFGRR